MSHQDLTVGSRERVKCTHLLQIQCFSQIHPPCVDSAAGIKVPNNTLPKGQSSKNDGTNRQGAPVRQLSVHRPDAPTIPRKKNERNTVAGRLRYTIDINVVFTRPTLASRLKERE